MELACGRAPVDPFDRRWVESELAGLVARAVAGEAEERLRAELFEQLWPWAADYAERMVERLPPRAEADETRSRLLLAVWQATERIDFAMYRAWPSLLRQRLDGARVDAARHDDALSRRHRQALAVANRSAAALEQARGRMLTDGERAGLTRACLSKRAPLGLAHALAEVGRGPRDEAGLDRQAAPEDWGPEQQALNGELREGLRRWFEHDLPPTLARRLAHWWAGSDTRDSLPAALAADLAPYLFRLVSFLEPVG